MASFRKLGKNWFYRFIDGDGKQRERTQANARDSDCTVWFGDPTTPGGKTTLRACHALGRPVFLVRDGITRPSELTTWLVAGYFEIVNIAGNRESTQPGIGERVERFLVAAFVRIA